ncbi:MAG: S8 family serine peptidase [Pseudomonadota bacterium]
MKKVAIIMFAFAFFLFPGILNAGEADLILKKMVSHLQNNQPTSWSKAAIDDYGSVLIPCLIRTKDPSLTKKAIEAYGGRALIFGAGAIISARLPVELVAWVTNRDEVEFVEAALPLSSKMDTARAATNVVSVQDASALGIAYDGTDVVIGVVDDGLDYGHPDFLGAGGISRIEYVRQNFVSGTVQCYHDTIVSGTCGIIDGGQGTTHGTHVTGIAAGADDIYTGVASGADIMFVFNDALDADTDGSLATSVIEGVSAIFSQADALDKAAVTNLSLGTSIGAHDGTSLLEQGLSDMVENKRGRIIVGAAGNEQVVPAAEPATRRDYVGGIHASIDVPAGASRGFRIGIWNGTGASWVFTGGTLVDLWLDTGQKDSCKVAAFAYTQGRVAEDFTFPGLATTDDASFATNDVSFVSDTASPVTADDGSVSVSIDIAASDARNSKPHANILFSAAAGQLGGTLETRWFDVVVRSTASACSGQMWLYYDYTAYHDFLKNIEGAGLDVGDGATHLGYELIDGDSLYTTTIPATAQGVIAVGSFMPPKPVGAASSEWTGNNGTTYDQSSLTAPGGTGSVTNDLSSFSSLGPTADGRTKPAIVAPGEPIIAAKARNSMTSTAITVGEDHFKNAGTSMASPHVAGIVALLLQRNNTLTVDQVRQALQAGADASGMTVKTPDPANTYGAGKVNAASIVGSVPADTSAYSGTGDTTASGSSGSCSLTCNQITPISFHLIPIVLLLFILSRTRAKSSLFSDH